jgi:cyclopropane fatty-acyl-phospholipid synthase-like methyltransferase
MIHQNGFWIGIEASSQHCYDPALGQAITNFFLNENAINIIDFGCGMGDYIKTMRQNNLNALGFDGNPHTPKLTDNLAMVLDLSVPVQFNMQADWVMSLEVGEHLPPQFEDIFINNLHNNTIRGIVLSWAVKGQGGYGHFNEQDNDYIKEKVCRLGYVNDVASETMLREKASVCYFKNTVMVFRKIVSVQPAATN